MNIIADCPVCGKGKMVEATNGYGCNHFKSLEDKCKFFIYTSYFEKQITEEIAKELCLNRETKLFTDLKKRNGEVFSAKLVISEDVIKPEFPSHELTNPCPGCGGKVVETANGFVCKNFFSKECKFYIAKKIANRIIEANVAEDLLLSGKTEFLDDFESNAGIAFSAKLILDEELMVKFDTTICPCPKCSTGIIYANSKAYGCSNFKDEAVKCDFVIWKEMSGKHISIDNVMQLCKNKSTNVLKGFKKKGGQTYNAKVVLNEDFKAVIQ